MKKPKKKKPWYVLPSTMETESFAAMLVACVVLAIVGGGLILTSVQWMRSATGMEASGMMKGLALACLLMLPFGIIALMLALILALILFCNAMTVLYNLDSRWRKDDEEDYE